MSIRESDLLSGARFSGGPWCCDGNASKKVGGAHMAEVKGAFHAVYAKIIISGTVKGQKILYSPLRNGKRCRGLQGIIICIGQW